MKNKLKILTKPLTTKEVKEKSKNGKKKFTVHVSVSTEEMIDNYLEDFLDIISERIHESGLLEDFSYKPVGMTKNKEVIFAVTGSASSILDSEEEND